MLNGVFASLWFSRVKTENGNVGLHVVDVLVADHLQVEY